MKQVLALGLVACSAPSVQTGPMPVGGHCNGMVDSVPSEEGLHVDPGTAIEWSTNPPVTGKHFPIWGAYDRTYTQLERGFYLHDAEHGGVVFLYNCPDGCPDTVAALEAVVRAMPADPQCVAPIRNRALVTGDPLLPAGVTVAAIAWNNYYTASCTDGYLATFASNHYGFGPEDFCTDGANFGGTFIDP